MNLTIISLNGAVRDSGSANSLSMGQGLATVSGAIASTCVSMNDSLLDGILPGGWIGVVQIFAACVCLASFSGLAALSRHPALAERICGRCRGDLNSTAPSPSAGASATNH